MPIVILSTIILIFPPCILSSIPALPSKSSRNHFYFQKEAYLPTWLQYLLKNAKYSKLVLWILKSQKILSGENLHQIYF